MPLRCLTRSSRRRISLARAFARWGHPKIRKSSFSRADQSVLIRPAAYSSSSQTFLLSVDPTNSPSKADRLKFSSRAPKRARGHPDSGRFAARRSAAPTCHIPRAHSRRKLLPTRPTTRDRKTLSAWVRVMISQSRPERSPSAGLGRHQNLKRRNKQTRRGDGAHIRGTLFV